MRVNFRRMSLRQLLVMLILAHLLVAMPGEVRAPDPWNTEVVVSDGNVGWFPSIVIDSDNRVHIAYVDGTDLGLKIAHQNGTGWDIETIEAGIIPGYTNLLMGSSDIMHLAYYDSTNEVVKYAFHSGDSWNIEVADSDVSCEMNEMLSMDLDSLETPHLAYCSRPEFWNSTLVYANKTGGTWKSQVIDWVDGSGFHAPEISISLDSGDIPHIMWHGIGNLLGIHFLEWDGNSWSDEIVHDDSWGTHPEEYPFMILDSNDVPRMSFGQVGSPYDGNLDLRYASKLDSSWVFETPDVGVLSPTGEVGWFSRIAFDSFGSPHISYREGGGGVPSDDLFYARWTGMSWEVERVDPGIVFWWSSIAIDHCNMPHIAYSEWSDGGDDANLKHAWKSCSAPMPDLTLAKQDIFFSPHTPVENGTSVQIDATIHNIGMANVTNVTVRFYKGTPNPIHQIGGDQTIPFIRYGLSETTGITWTAQPEGIHDICVVADPDHQIDEMNIMNNEACRTIEVVLPLPDLKVSQEDISLNQSTPVQNGSSVQINATIHNIGGADAINVSVRIFDNPFGQIEEDKVIALVPVGGSESAEVSWNATPVGSHEICVTADPENQIAELDETNNEACVVVEVAETTIPSPPGNVNAFLSGAVAENVTLSWTLSPDDGAGLNNVIRYDIYRGTSYDANGAGYLLHSSVPNGTASFLDPAAGEGNPNDYLYYVCAVNSASFSSCSADQAGKFTRPLSLGQNLVSIPLVQSNESIEYVLQTVEYDKAWYYDSLSRQWYWHMTFKGYRRGLWNINHTMGIWINVTEDCNLTVAGIVPSVTQIHLYEGWNLVSFPSFNSSHTVYDVNAEVGSTRVEGHDSLDPYFLRVLEDVEMLQAGRGYWVRVQADVVWTIDVN